MQEHNQGHLKFLLAIATPCTLVCVYLVYWYLLQIEINKTLSLPTTPRKEDSGSSNNNTDGGLEEEQADNSVAVPDEQDRPRRFRIAKLRNLILIGTALGLSFLTYLLLVVSNASIWLSALGVALVITVGCWNQICEELRRQRFDRLCAIVTLLILAAAFMSLAVYAQSSLAEGEIYQGKARIIGFDYTSYDNSDGDITRTDLEVEWGSEWGCPQLDGKTCQAFVQGAMCEAEEDDKDDKGGNRQRRYLEDANNNGNNANNQNNNDQNNNNQNNNNGNANNNNNNNNQGQDAADESQDLEEENQELEEENQELEEEVEEYEEYAEDLEEEVEDAYTYYWDDNLFEDGYWDAQDWSSIWGDYACYDLFDYDMSGAIYNANDQPGHDGWPFVNIYGNCKSCDAYIVDYFSTEHYQELQKYRINGRNFMIVGIFGIALTALMAFKHRMDPIAEKELELLPNDGGAIA